MPIANIASGVNLYYEETGMGERRILFVHGILGDYRTWKSQVEALAANSSNYKMISVSRRSSFPNNNASIESTIQSNANDLYSLVQSLNIEKLDLVGHSFGGFVSLYFVSRHPEIVRSLVLLEPAVPSILVENEGNPLQVLGLLLSNPSAASSARRFQSRLKPCLKAFENGDLKSAVKQFYDGIKEEDGAFENRLSEETRGMMIQDALTVGEANTEFPIFSKNDARTVGVPTLLVKGEKSPRWLTAIVDSLGKLMPNSRVVEIANSGHFIQIEQPSALNEELIKFLSS